MLYHKVKLMLAVAFITTILRVNYSLAGNKLERKLWVSFCVKHGWVIKWTFLRTVFDNRFRYDALEQRRIINYNAACRGHEIPIFERRTLPHHSYVLNSSDWYPGAEDISKNYWIHLEPRSNTRTIETRVMIFTF